MNAFVDEVLRSYRPGSSAPRKMVECLLGEARRGFCKVIGIGGKWIAQARGFNPRGALNRASRPAAPEVEAPRVLLPSRITRLGLKPGGKSAAGLCTDAYRQFAFRIRNASTRA